MSWRRQMKALQTENEKLVAENLAMKALPDDPIRKEREELGIRLDTLQKENGDFRKQVQDSQENLCSANNRIATLTKKLTDATICITKLEGVKSAESKQRTK